MCARDIHPVNNAAGSVTVAEAEFNQGRYLHSASHGKDGYDKLCFDQLSSGNEPAGRLLQSDGVGGAEFVPVPALLIARGQYNGKKVRYKVPTVVDRVSLPHSIDEATTSSRRHHYFQATLVSRGGLCNWRLYHPQQHLTIAQGVGNNPEYFSVNAAIVSGHAVELHVWLDVNNNNNNNNNEIVSNDVKIDEFRLVSINVPPS